MEDLSYLNPNNINHKLRFMLKKCSCSYASMAYWLSVPEFEAEMLRMVEERTEIKDETVLPVMQRIYQEKLEKRKSDRKAWRSGEFLTGYAKTGMREIRRAIERKA